MALETVFYIARVVFRPLRRVVLTAWSGVYAGRAVYESLNRAGIVLDRGGLFRVSPVYPMGSHAPVGGYLAPGEQYWFRAVFWGAPGSASGQQLARGLIAGLGLWTRELVVEELSLEERRVLLPDPGAGEGEADGEPVAALVRVRHGPTFYRFHGAVVSYPSPWRLVASIARRLSLATGIDYRPLARRLQPCLELAVDRTRRVRIRLSHGAEPPVFTGEALYHAVCPRGLASALQRLLEASVYTGAGASPGLGLGEIHAVDLGPPRHRAPPALEPWTEEQEEPSEAEKEARPA